MGERSGLHHSIGEANETLAYAVTTDDVVVDSSISLAILFSLPGPLSDPLTSKQVIETMIGAASDQICAMGSVRNHRTAEVPITCELADSLLN